MSDHFILSPSSSGRWLNCTASVEYIETFNQVPEKPSYPAAEGTVAHALAERCLVEQKRPDVELGEVVEQDGFSITIDQEMIDSVNLYLDAVAKLTPLDASDFLWPEVRLPLFYSFRGKQGFGSSDVVFYDRETGGLHVFDLKYGRHEVEADGNTQLLIYGISAYDEYRDYFNIAFVSVHIIQPRIKNFSRRVYTFKELEKFRKETLLKVKQIEEGAVTFSASEQACHWCPARGQCKHEARNNMRILSADFEDLDALESETLPEPTAPEELTDEQVALVVKHSGMFKRWLSDVETLAADRIMAGGQIEGLKVVAGRGSRKWADDADAEKMLNSKFTKDEIFEKTLLSVAKAEKMVKANPDKVTPHFTKKFESLVVKSEGKPTLVLSSDKREALDFAADFEDLDAIEDDDFLM
ncbi:MAG: hypothetical protein Unbinned6354contig1000_43 [Prokaryotic dsDNA virus sp.]|nr:hypothetical protein [Cytophagaceae bacterium]QDP54340.1 MAG: hypothetical protein Unbinned6354contig1000_43 [Prokaryotic dsDNA virus sp.]|tara:strand:- start:9504 stop:10739 length:1236 start_codon:yes stop_codon:yes gene_type:complete